MRLLLVEDDKQLGDGICAGLGLEGYNVDWGHDGNSAEEALQKERFDIVVLDLGLPHRSPEAVREIIGSGTLFGVSIMWESFKPFSVMVKAPGAFVCLGLILTLMNWISARQKGRR